MGEVGSKSIVSVVRKAEKVQRGTKAGCGDRYYGGGGVFQDGEVPGIKVPQTLEIAWRGFPAT